MKKEFQDPRLEILPFLAGDILAASDPSDDGIDGGNDSYELPRV